MLLDVRQDKKCFAGNCPALSGARAIFLGGIMKKIILVVMIFLMFPVQAFADSLVASNTYYESYKDQYRMDYEIIPAASYELYFVAPDAQIYTAEYAFAPTGIHYLTCIGTYHLNFFDGSGTLIGHTADVVTTEIVAPTCSSSAGTSTATNDLNAKIQNGNIIWDTNPSAVTYDIYKNGTKVGTTTGTDYLPDGSGGYSIVAKDANGNVVASSDVTVDPINCDECQKLAQLLQCPDWSTYMSDFTTAFQNALPPPPNWDDIASKIGTATITDLQNYMGVVPASPDQSTIDNNLSKPMPTLDTATTATYIAPSVPPGYEVSKPFDITTGTQIPIVDNSQPFSILDPLSNLTFTAPGVPITPGDSANNTGGILKPTNTSYPTVTPKPLPSPLPNEIVPKPSSSPSSTGGAYPIPTTVTSSTYQAIPIPIYYGN